MRIIDKSWIKPLSLGSIILGSGGGGKTNNLVFLLEDIITKNGGIPLLDLKDLKNGDYYCSTGMIGSTQLIDDFYFSGHEGVVTVKEIQKIKEKEIKGIFPLEAAGVNTLYPIVVAGLMGIPIINGDCMGRAFPEIQMTVFQIGDENILPFILNDTRNKIHIFDKGETFIVDLNIRKILSEIDNLGFFSCAVKKGYELKNRLISETISLTKDIGETFIEGSEYENILDKIIFITKNSVYGSAIELFKGEIKKIDKNSGSNWQTIQINGIEDYSKKDYKIMSKNEYLISFLNDEISCMVPDIMVTIDLERLIPVNIEDIRKNMKVAIIGIPAPVNLKTNKALNIVGPTSFGYKSTYKALEKTYYDYYY